MKYSIFLFFAPLTPILGLPTGSLMDTKALITKRCSKYQCPSPAALLYPKGFDASTCPDTTGGNNLFANYFAPHDKKRSLHKAQEQSSISLLPRQNQPCQEIAFNDAIHGFNPGNRNVGNTGQVTLQPGATYILSWGLDQAVRSIRTFNHSDDDYDQFLPAYTPEQTAGTFFGTEQGTFQFTVPQGHAPAAHFEFQFEGPGYQYDVNGQIALFFIAPAGK